MSNVERCPVIVVRYLSNWLAAGVRHFFPELSRRFSENPWQRSRKKTTSNDHSRQRLPMNLRRSLSRSVAECRKDSFRISTFIENASDSNIYHLTEHFSIVESSLRATIFIQLIPRLFPDYSLATLRIAVIFLAIITLIKKQFSLCKKKMNERKWKHNALHTMNVRLVRRNKMKLLKRL